MSSSSNPHFPQVPKAGSIADLPKDGTNETASNLDTARSAVSASSMSPEEKEREKGRLQKLVKDFAKEVVSGIPVNLVNPATAHPSPHFFQDYSVKELTKIYKGPEVLMNAPNLGVLAQHCVAFDTTRVQALWASSIALVYDLLTLSCQEALERDKFYTCLKILRMSVDISQSGQTSS
ncbi:unnamed protein product [Durusdinium trenchii]|uniref:Uncharacterized protein n=1 Tax=Durusdinium trenchii TaxID=1381693 RepID=A0ABP0Q430_9DINO